MNESGTKRVGSEDNLGEKYLRDPNTSRPLEDHCYELKPGRCSTYCPQNE